MKKLLLSFGTITTIVVPLSITISCGSSEYMASIGKVSVDGNTLIIDGFSGPKITDESDESIETKKKWAEEIGHFIGNINNKVAITRIKLVGNITSSIDGETDVSVVSGTIEIKDILGLPNDVTLETIIQIIPGRAGWSSEASVFIAAFRKLVEEI